MEVDQQEVDFMDENVSLERDNVSKVIKFAKLDPNTISSTIQQIYFASPEELDSDSIKLLELDAKVLEYVEKGGKLTIKGNESDNCVLCTDKLTYEVKEAAVSNSLLLVDGLRAGTSDQLTCANTSNITLHPVRIRNTCHSYLELKSMKPKLNVLKSLLAPSLYKGPELENDTMRKLSYDDVVNSINASAQEIDTAMSAIDTVILDGYVRLLDFDYLCRVLSSIIGVIEENSWKWDMFSYDTTLETLSNLYPSIILRHVMEAYGYKAKVADVSSNDWSLHEDKVCKFYAELLLRPTNQFNKAEFLEAWKLSVPEGMVTSLSQIDGLAFSDHTNDPPVVRYFPESDLSDDIKQRFEQLFAAKTSWTAEELTPYLQPLCIGKMTVSLLITKHARGFTRSGVKYYTSKYGR